MRVRIISVSHFTDSLKISFFLSFFLFFSNFKFNIYKAITTLHFTTLYTKLSQSIKSKQIKQKQTTSKQKSKQNLDSNSIQLNILRFKKVAFSLLVSLCRLILYFSHLFNFFQSSKFFFLQNCL